MGGDRAIRERNKVTYAEYDDDDFDSPVKKVPKKTVIDSEEEEVEEKPTKGGLLAYAKKGINNAREDLEASAGAKKPKRAPKANDLDDTDDEMLDEVDLIEDSDLDEENEQPMLQKQQKQQQRPGRAAAPKGSLRVSAASSDEDEEDADHDESGEESSEEEELAASSEGSSSEEDEEDHEMAEQDSDSDADAKIKPTTTAPSKKKDTTTTTGGRSIRPRAAAAAPAPAAGGSRRSVRATAAAAKTYNEDEIMGQYYSSEEEEEEPEAPQDEKSIPNRRTIVKKPSFDSNEENREPSSLRQSSRPQRSAAAAAAAKKKASGYATSDDELFEDDSDNEASKEANSEDEDGAIYLSSGSDGEYGGGDGNADEDREDMVMDDEDYDEETLVNSVERILALRKVNNDVELYVKISGWSFRRARWLPRSVLVAAGRAQLVRNFEKKAVDGSIDPYGDLVNGVHPNWLDVDRVLSSKESSRLGLWYLVKWKGLGHSEATWERASALEHSEADKDAVARYHKRAEAAAARLEDEVNGKQPESKELDPTAIPEFLNSRSLRPYQLESLEWMAKHWCTGSNCILGDEMGLGKTAQSISVLAYQRQFGGVHGPFLVIAPLTTLGHWQREIETWTDMDCVVYAGSAADRAACQKHDLFVPGSSGGGRGRRGRLVKPNVVLSSYETVLRDASLFTSIEWESVIIDEAHRMKTVGSSTRTAIADLDMGWLLLLTGTPVQNNMRELFGLLNLVDSEEYPSEADFLDRFGDERTGMSPQQVRELQKALKPILLRRMKEDVETLPEKEECIIWTQLTIEQRAYYKAIFEKQIGTLLGGVSQKNVPNLRNLAMELRKVCCHPFLCDGLEDDVAARRRAAGLATDEISSIVQASGKMLLLHKLLPKLRSEGHKVLIFSQFKIMLDVLEDYMRASQFPCERIDGSTSSRDRQAAIDRYSKEGSDGFVFLLSTRAGGQGITLTAADTCIIYDSDWNPQNDLQAMARCHRIGQEKDVTIYRLVSKDTYEEHVFKTSSRKYGLDEAILGGIAGGGNGGNGGGGNGDELDGKKIAELLKHGAHCLDKVEEANAETEAFASEDIDQILKGRTEKRQIGGRAGNTFSIATFEVDGGGTAGGTNATTKADESTFWATLLPEAAAAHETAKIAAKQGHIMLAPRQRKKVSYTDGTLSRKRRSGSSNDDSEFEATEDGQDSDSGTGTGGKAGGATKKQNVATAAPAAVSGPPAPKPWAIKDANNYFDQLMRYGFSATVGVPKAVVAAGLDSKAKGYRQEDFPAVAAALHAMLLGAPNVAPQKPPRVPSVQHETDRQQRMLYESYSNDMKMAATPEEREAAYKKIMKFGSEQITVAKGLAVIEIDRIKQENAKWEASIKANGATTLATTCAAALIPSHCMRALQDVKLAERMIKFNDSYISHLKEVELLSNWAQVDRQAPAFPHKNGTFPHWWSRAEDTNLLKGLFSLGFGPLRKQAESVDAVLQDPAFGFTNKMMLMPAQGAGGNSGDAINGASGSGVAMIKDDSFQVRPSPAQAEEAEGATKNGDNDQDDFKSTPAAPVLAPIPGTAATIASASTSNIPRVYKLPEWNKFRDTLTRHVKSMLQYLKKVEENNLKIAQHTTGNSNLNGAGPSRQLSSMPSTDISMDTSMSTDVKMESEGSGSMISNLNTGAGVSIPVTNGPAAKKSSGADKEMLMTLLKREHLKQVESSMAAKSSVPVKKEEDPIESFSDEEKEAKALQPVQKKQKKSPSPPAVATATATKPTSGAVATPGSGTVSALNVFKETRGDFTDGASGSAQAASKPTTGAPTAAAAAAGNAANGQKKAKSKSGGGSMGSQRSLFDMPKVMKYYKRGEEGATQGEDAGNEDAEQQREQMKEEDVIDLVGSD